MNAVSSLPQRSDVVIRGAHVMTMDGALGDIAAGDVHVRDGAIVAVGRGIEAPGAAVIDGEGMIAMPGLVDTHWHMWNSLLRSMAGDSPERGYFPTTAALGKTFLPGDMYCGTMLAAAEALNGGITFVHDWCHNARTYDHALGSLRALQDAGIRGRFSYGFPAGQAFTEGIDLDGLERLHRDWPRQSNGGLLTLGLGWRGVSAFGVARAPDVYRREIDTARRLGLPISVHANQVRGRCEGEIAETAKQGLLGRDMQVIHATQVTPQEIEALASSGASISLSPYTEMRIGYGLPPTGAFLAAGIPVGLSVDTTELSGNADMFAIMKAIQNVENARAESEFRLPPRRVLELATIEGARTMGIDDRIGSLVPGKRADLILVSTEDVNIGPLTEATHLLVEAAQPANVDTVMVDGRVMKRGGKLTALDPRQVVRNARGALAGVRARAGWG